MTEQTEYIQCPICGEPINRDECEIMGHLSTWGYMHVDYWLRCPKCKYSPCFGKELEDTKPIYWHPQNTPTWYKKAVTKAANKHFPNQQCIFDNTTMELHKVWINSYRELCDGPTQFVLPSEKDSIQKYFLPSGILLQFKCKNWRCKYVRYVTL